MAATRRRSTRGPSGSRRLLVGRLARGVPDGENLDRLLVHAIEQPIRKIDEGGDAHARTLGDFGRAVRELEQALLDRRQPRFKCRERRSPVDRLILVDRIEVRERAIGVANPHSMRNFARTASTA